MNNTEVNIDIQVFVRPETLPSLLSICYGLKSYSNSQHNLK